MAMKKKHLGSLRSQSMESSSFSTGKVEVASEHKRQSGGNVQEGASIFVSIGSVKLAKLRL